MYFKTKHKHKGGGGCEHTARGEKFRPGGLIPSTQGQGIGRIVLHNAPPETANKALECFVTAIQNMEAVEASQLAAAGTIAEMRRCFPTATKLNEAEAEILTLIKIRRLDVKGRKPNKILNKRLCM